MLVDDVRECPATWTLATSWVLVFMLMHLAQWWQGIPMPAGGLANPLAVSSFVGHRFGDMTWAEVQHGEIWRLVTATFVHFSLLHLGMNAFGLIKLGQLIEPWYRSGPFLAICVTIGGLGNLVGGLLRVGFTFGKVALVGSPIAKAWPSFFDLGGDEGIAVSFNTPSGGGSTILLGLLGLGAVVGWRSHTRIGSFLRDQMVALLGFTAVLGLILFQLIDNYGHAGGAIVGAGVGFVHRPLLRISERSRIFRASCWGMVGAVLLACVVVGAREDRAEAGFRVEYARAEARFNVDQATLLDLERVSILYARTLGLAVETGQLAQPVDIVALEPILKGLATAPVPNTPKPLTPDQWQTRTQAELRAALNSLASQLDTPRREGVSRDLAELLVLGRQALEDVPDYRQAYAFALAWRSAVVAISQDRDQAKTNLARFDR